MEFVQGREKYKRNPVFERAALAKKMKRRSAGSEDGTRLRGEGISCNKKTLTIKGRRIAPTRRKSSTSSPLQERARMRIILAQNTLRAKYCSRAAAQSVTTQRVTDRYESMSRRLRRERRRRTDRSDTHNRVTLCIPGSWVFARLVTALFLSGKGVCGLLLGLSCILLYLCIGFGGCIEREVG